MHPRMVLFTGIRDLWFDEIVERPQYGLPFAHLMDEVKFELIRFNTHVMVQVRIWDHKDPSDTILWFPEPVCCLSSGFDNITEQIADTLGESDEEIRRKFLPIWNKRHDVEDDARVF